MTTSNILYATTVNDTIATPVELYNDLDQHFHFDFDPCPLNPDPEFDGLQCEWGERNFINPPFSNVEAWIRKAVSTGKLCVMLFPARTMNEYWRELVWPHADRIYFFQRRITFVGFARPFPAPIAIVVFHAPASLRPLPVYEQLGGVPVATVTHWHAPAFTRHVPMKRRRKNPTQ